MSITRRLRAALRAPSHEERALAYLNESTSLADLERREREIDSGRFRQNRHAF
ncbi:DUF3563 family protein [Aureimonas sp. Leaf324]|jgi:hypothetical protein|uniref:DUF3563 family protein n=1 Tax=Aureimonas sp. Leaf324 TaxID=1736336 RepID=UPI000ADF4B69|nr:DUF3563 family protein [Aureimonas sp. Leaf324]